jgi:hypothetical protein
MCCVDQLNPPHKAELGEGQLSTQSDLLAKMPQSGHPDAGGMYHATVRLSLEPDRHFLGQADLGDFM